MLTIDKKFKRILRDYHTIASNFNPNKTLLRNLRRKKKEKLTNIRDFAQ
jgi:hypothetical protein